VVTRIEKKIVDIALRHALSSEVERLKKNNIKPTTERVLKNADEKAIAVLLGQGYTTKELVKITEDVIRRQECKE